MEVLYLVFVVFVLFCFVAFVYLIVLNMKKLYTYNEVSYDIPEVNSLLMSPVIYEVAYVSKQNNDWTFSKEGNFTELNNMVNDFLNNRINYLIIKGNLYKILDVKNNILNRAIFSLDPSCTTTASFTTCSIENMTANNAYTVLHVIGYHVPS